MLRMRKSFIFALFGLLPLAFAACVGDGTPGVAPGADGSSGGTPPGTPPPGAGDDASSDTGGSSGDAGGDGDSAAPKCGYAGEACCGGGLAPCNQGTVCTSNVCVVNDIVVVGDSVNIMTFHHNGISALYNGLAWTQGPNLGADADDLIPWGVWAAKPGEYWAVTGSTAGANGNKLMLYSGGASPRWLVCGNFGCDDPMAGTNQLYSVLGFGVADMWVAGNT